jgi:hypothetical protein
MWAQGLLTSERLEFFTYHVKGMSQSSLQEGPCRRPVANWIAESENGVRRHRLRLCSKMLRAHAQSPRGIELIYCRLYAGKRFRRKAPLQKGRQTIQGMSISPRGSRYSEALEDFGDGA